MSDPIASRAFVRLCLTTQIKCTNTARSSIPALDRQAEPDLPDCSDGSYGVDEGLIFGFPLTSDGQSCSIQPGIEHNAFAEEKVNATLAELREERDTVKDLL